MAQNSRKALLTDLAARLSSATGPELPKRLPAFPHSEDLTALFRRELEAVAGVFYDARSQSGLADALAALLGEAGTEEIVWESGACFEKHAIPIDASPEEGPPSETDPPLRRSVHPEGRVRLPIRAEVLPYDRDALARVPLVISDATAGIAETGTIVLEVRPPLGRLASVLPPNHAVLLRERDLIADHADYFEAVRFGRSGSATIFVTGPSRTADIEKRLVVGVHGPKRFSVLLTN